jgi:hypothetical protein
MSSKGSQGDLGKPLGLACQLGEVHHFLTYITFGRMSFKQEYLPGGIHIELSHHIQGSFEF